MIKRLPYRFILQAVAVFILFIQPCIVFSQVRFEKEMEKPRLCEEKAKDETRWMTKNLYLSSDQYDKIQTLNLYYACLMESLNRLSDKAVISKKKTELIKNKDAEFKAVLSEEQFLQYKNHKDKKVEQKKSPFSSQI